MKQPKDYAAAALQAGEACKTEQEAVKQGSDYGSMIANEVFAFEEQTQVVNQDTRRQIELVLEHTKLSQGRGTPARTFLESAHVIVAGQFRWKEP